MAWERYDAYQPHPFETSTGMEGGCHHCGGPYNAFVHNEPWNPPLPESVPDISKPDPEARYEYLDTATYDEPVSFADTQVKAAEDYGHTLGYP